MTVVGTGLDRVDARDKVTGKATYTADTQVANLVHAVIVGSAIARGKLASIDVRAARKSAGVLAVMAIGDAPELPKPDAKSGQNDRVLQLLQDSTIVYADQPIAVVVADTLEHAQRAAGLVVARYTETAPVAEMATALDDAYMPKKAGPRGEPESSRGDVDAGLAVAKLALGATIDATYTTPVETHNPMEPHATVAVWQGRDRLTVYDATQGIFGVRQRLSTIFGLEPKNVRVISKFLGGGFGCKGSPWSHVPLCAMAARLVGRPVKLVVTRQQMAAFVGHRPKTIQRIELGALGDGTLTAIRHDVLSETSRFDEFVEPSALQTRMLYACDNVATKHRLVRIDIPTPTFTRAPGEATGTYALECAMDELAVALAIDPLALRQANYAETDPDTGHPWSSKSLRDCYARAATTFGWARRSAAPRSMRDGKLLVGWGMATATYPARQMAASARAKRLVDGSILVQAGTQDIGTGTYTIMTQIAADELGIDPSFVRFELGDTQFPETPLSAGSFTASSTGSAVKVACAKLRVLIATSAPGVELEVEVKTEPSKDRDGHAIHAFGAVFAEVAVDEALGQVRVRRVVGSYGCGKILNPKTARSQLIGGIVWSIGMALTEETARDPRSARAMTRDLADYHVPTHADVPDIDVSFVDEADAYVNELGAKGLGEIGNTGAAAAIANAVYHATGVRVRDLPITPDKLVRT